MFRILLLPLWFVVVSCYALKVISITPPLIEISPYLDLQGSKGLAGVENTGLMQDDFRLPVKSSIQAGSLSRRVIQNPGFSYPLFIVGDDARSREWLKEHADYLKHIQALGLVTNVSSASSLEALETLANMPLAPVNVDDLVTLLAIKHYPVVVEQGVVWQ